MVWKEGNGSGYCQLAQEGHFEGRLDLYGQEEGNGRKILQECIHIHTRYVKSHPKSFGTGYV